jgi:hypothetical protein
MYLQRVIDVTETYILRDALIACTMYHFLSALDVRPLKD